MVQWLRLHASTTGGTGSIPGRGTKILHAAGQGQTKQKNYHLLERLVLYSELDIFRFKI